MAVKSNVDSFVKKTRAMAGSIPAAERAGVQAAAAAAQRSILSAARGRGVNARERWVSIEQRGGTQRPQALLQLRGAKAYWAERGTKAHSITPKRKKAILTPQGPRASAYVRGAKARPFWKQGVAAAEGPASRAGAEAVATAIRRGVSG